LAAPIDRKRNFQGRDKEAETALEIQGRRCRDKISLGNSANSGVIAGFREISVRTRMRGGAERSPTMGRINGLQKVRVEKGSLNAKEDFAATHTPRPPSLKTRLLSAWR
jgi:hypothetical protein